MPDVAMWVKALRIIPRLSKEQWERLDLVSRWLIVTRSAVFIMTATSTAVGGLMAWLDGYFSWRRFLLCLLGLVFAHATNNLVNDYTDHKKGVDRDNYYRSQYGPHPIEHGLMSLGQLWTYIIVTGALALACGVLLAFMLGWGVVWLMLAGAFFVLFYTWPLKYIGLGEPAVLLVWGPLMVGGAYFAASGGQWSHAAALVGLAYAIGPTTVLFGKHTDKLDQDREKGIRTLPVILGEKNARMVTMGLWIFQYMLITALVACGVLGWPMLAVFLAVPKLVWACRIYAQPRPSKPPEELPPDVWPLFLSAVAFVYNRLLGILFLAGLLVQAVLTALGLY